MKELEQDLMLEAVSGVDDEVDELTFVDEFVEWSLITGEPQR